MMILLGAMAVLLPVLAGLQYYWLGEVSKGATERLQSNLATGARRFREDFNREFIRAYLNFHIDSSSPPEDLAAYHFKRLEKWNTMAPYPELISGVYVVDQTFRVRRVNLQTRELESVDSTPEGQAINERFKKSAGELPLESFDEDLPALIVPIPNLQSKEPDTASSTRSFTVVTLNLNYLKGQFIPSLISRHFGDSSNEYNFGMAPLRHPERVIYSSSGSADFSASDVTTRVFAFEPDEFQAFVRSEANSASEGNPRLLRLNVRLLKGTQPSSTEDDGWQFAIKHQAGSLATAVNSIRRRNLALSFGILLLLGSAIALTAISMRRAERLAEQQINFVAGVTHELRTPLAVICSAGENLADGVVNNPANVAEYGKVIHQEGRRLSDMVEQVLEFAGARSGQRRYEFRPVQVDQVVTEALSACDALIRQTGTEVETTISPDLPEVHGDPVALKQALQNLFSNAIKYGGTKQSVRINAYGSANQILIAIEDAGMGISKADISRIFEPFYRGREAIAEQIPGTGIGLSLVKQIVEAHNGSISVKSSPGAGTVFTLQLPVASEATDLSGLVESAPRIT